MKLLKAIIQYGVTPAFFILAIINYLAERTGGGHGGHSGHQMQQMGNMAMENMVQPTASIWTSMWLMYLLMGLAHIGPYLSKTDKSE